MVNVVVVSVVVVSVVVISVAVVSGQCGSGQCGSGQWSVWQWSVLSRSSPPPPPPPTHRKVQSLLPIRAVDHRAPLGRVNARVSVHVKHPAIVLAVLHHKVVKPERQVEGGVAVDDVDGRVDSIPIRLLFQVLEIHVHPRGLEDYFRLTRLFGGLGGGDEETSIRYENYGTMSVGHYSRVAGKGHASVFPTFYFRFPDFLLPFSRLLLHFVKQNLFSFSRLFIFLTFFS